MYDPAKDADTDKRTLGTELLLNVAQVANSTLDLQKILEKITAIIAESLKKDVCSIYLLKPSGQTCLEATKGLREDAVGRVCFNPGEGIVGWVAQQGRPLAVENIREEPLFKDIALSGASGFLSMLAVPIVRDRKIRGVITLQTSDPYAYSPDEINMLTLIAHYVSVSIRNAELYRSVKTQFDELKIIHEIGTAITSILSLDRLLPYICEEVTKLLHSKGCILRLFEDDLLQIKASYGLPEKIQQAMNLRKGEGIAGQVALSGTPLLIDDVSKMPENLRIPVIDATSVICVPLKIGNNIIGTLGLYDKKDEQGITSFTQSDIGMLSTFASVASISIENARLYKRELEKEKKILSLYWEVAQTKDYLESLIDNSADAIVISDTQGLISSWNKSAEKIYGYTEEEVLGKFLPMVPPYLKEQEEQSIKKILNQETIKNIETIRQTKDGRIIEVSLTLSPVLDSSGNVTGISGISRDISEKKRVENELIRKNQELSRLFFMNSVVRSTLELDKLLRIFLTVVTMSDGLGFNRAILFLTDKEQTAIQGIMGVGPQSPEEAGNIWFSLEGKSLETIIEEIERGPLSKDSRFDRLSQSLTIPLDDNWIITQCVKEKKPINIPDVRAVTGIHPLLTQMLGTNAFGIVPLVTRGTTIGIIFVDNYFTGKKITDDDLKFLLGFTSQMAPAIENARLFRDVSLARSELEKVFESISDMIYYTDKDFNIININHAVIERIGRPAGEIIGKKCYEVFHGKDSPHDVCPHAKAITMKKPFIEEMEDFHLKGTFVVSSSPVFDSSGAFLGTVNVSRDITELDELRERVNSSERMAALGEMAARVAHEIRNPLISVGGFARRLEKKLEGEPLENARIIVEEVKRLENILKEILAFVKGSRYIKTEIDLNDVIKNVVNLMKAEMAEKGNTLVLDLCVAPVMSKVDSDRIKEAILNVVKNANQSTEGGTVLIKTGIRDKEALIEVSDNGYGIKQEDLKNIFTPFYTTMPYGTGLGLSITNRIIQEHSGRIEVESTYRGKTGDESGAPRGEGGTTFRICLPLVAS